MTPKLADIAKATNTSVTTVSRVLAGGATAQRISEATRKRVLDEAERQGYKPNLLARSLRTRKTQTIALMVSDITNPWFGQIALFVEQELAKQEYWLMLCNSQEDAKVEEEYLGLMPQKGIDGLIIFPIMRDRDKLRQLIGDDLPLVVLDRPIEGIDAYVASDEVQSAKLLCDTLQPVGVKKIGLVCGPSELVTHQRRAELVSERFEVVAEHQGPALQATGQQALAEFGDTEMDAIICTNNVLGIGAVHPKAQNGTQRIIGCFDEIPMMDLLPVPVACSAQDVSLLAETAARLMLLQIENHGGDEDLDVAGVLLNTHAVTNAAFDALPKV